MRKKALGGVSRACASHARHPTTLRYGTMSPSGKGGVPVNTPSPNVRTLGQTEPPPPPVERFVPPDTPLRLWLMLLGMFLMVSAATLLQNPAAQVDGLVSHARLPQQKGFGCPRAPWCSHTPSCNVDADVAVHLVRSLGAAYAVLGAMAAASGTVPARQLIAVALILAVWSVYSVTAQPAFLSNDDARRRFMFHIVILLVTLLNLGWSLKSHISDRH